MKLYLKSFNMVKQESSRKLNAKKIMSIILALNPGIILKLFMFEAKK